MAYATYTDVQAHFTHITFGAGTTPSTTNITEWLALAESILNGLLVSRGVGIPTEGTHPNAFHICKRLVTLNASARAAEALFYGVEPAENDQAARLWDEYWQLYREIEKNPRFMYDASITRPTMKTYAIDEWGTADAADQPRMDFNEKF